MARPRFATSSNCRHSSSAFSVSASMAARLMPAGGAVDDWSVSSIARCSVSALATISPWVEGDSGPSASMLTPPACSRAIICSAPARSSACIARAHSLAPRRFALRILLCALSIMSERMWARSSLGLDWLARSSCRFSRLWNTLFSMMDSCSEGARGLSPRPSCRASSIRLMSLTLWPCSFAKAKRVPVVLLQISCRLRVLPSGSSSVIQLWGSN